MKKSFVFLLLFFMLIALPSSAALLREDALKYVQDNNLLPTVSEDFLTYADFYAAVAAAFPGQEGLIEPTNDYVTRESFIVLLVDILDLTAEAQQFTEIVTMANDEELVSEEAIGAFTLAFRSDRQLMTYRYGHVLEPAAPITKKETAHSIYMALYPPQQGGRITTAVMADAPGFNTLFTSAGLVWTLNNIIGDGYAGTNQDGFYHPRMIRRIPSVENGLIELGDDGTMAITYELRSGMKWHDGHEVTAADAKFQWEVMTSDAPITSNYFEVGVNRVEIIDDLTFTIHLDEVFSNAELGSSVYAYYYGWFQLPKHAFAEDFATAQATGNWNQFMDKVNANPIMTGPYRFKEYVEGQYLVIEAFDDYFMGRPNIDEIVLRIIPDSDVIYASTLAGEIDFGRYTLSIQQSIQLERERPDLFETYFTPNVAVHMIFLNYNDPANLDLPHRVLEEQAVRQALMYGTDRDRLNQLINFGLAEIADTWITELHSMRDALASDSITRYNYDVEKAKTILDQAGWEVGRGGVRIKDGQRLEFTITGGAGSRDNEMMAQLLQAMWREIGVNLIIDLKPMQIIWAETYPMREFDAIITGWGYGITDEAANYWGSGSIPAAANNFGGTNYGGWSNAENDKIIEQAVREIDHDKKVALYEQHFALFSAELPVLPIYSAPTPHFAKSYLKSFNSGYDNGLGWIIYNWYLE